MKLFSDFPAVSKTEWKEKAVKDLKGIDFDKKLVWQTYDEFAVQPFYTPEDMEGLESFVTRNQSVTKKNPSWINYSAIEAADPATINALALNAIQFGAKGLLIQVADQDNFNFEESFKGINPATIHISFLLKSPAREFVAAYFDYLRQHNISLDAINGFCDIDILEHMAVSGAPWDFDSLAAMLNQTKQAPHFYGLTIHSHAFINAGSNTTQELAFTLNKLTDYIDKLSEKGLTPEEIIKETCFHLAIGGDYFFEIAKLRALRILVNTIIQAYKVKDVYVPVLSSSSHWSKSACDEEVNMLRNTTEAMSAILGGCDALLIKPHNEPTDLSRRIALNVSNILEGESYFDKVQDPASGSYYIENLTKTLCENALELFKAIEQEGGFIQAFEQNLIQERIEKTRNKKQQDIATRKQVYVGANQYVNANENIQALLKEEQVNTKNSKLLMPQHAAEAFEQLRLRTYQYHQNTKVLPRVYLACFGNLAMYKARAGFSTNFFRAAGFEIMGEFFFSDITQAASTSASSDADIVVMCSSDDDYALHAAAFAKAFKQKSSGKSLVLAGYPAAIIDELKAAGVDTFIHIKSNAVDVLTSFQNKLLATV